MIYGYARVSIDGQNGDSQIRQLRAAEADQVFRETASGAKSNPAALRRMLGQLAADVFMATFLERVARSTYDLSDQPGI